MKNLFLLSEKRLGNFTYKYKIQIHKQIISVKNTVKPRPEAHMDMILFEVFWENIHLIPQEQIV